MRTGAASEAVGILTTDYADFTDYADCCSGKIRVIPVIQIICGSKNRRCMTVDSLP